VELARAAVEEPLPRCFRGGTRRGREQASVLQRAAAEDLARRLGLQRDRAAEASLGIEHGETSERVVRGHDRVARTAPHVREAPELARPLSLATPVQDVSAARAVDTDLP